MIDKKDDRYENEKGDRPAQKPDRETLNTTDPQENMKGPVSSTTKQTGHAFETDETKEHADQIKEKNI